MELDETEHLIAILRRHVITGLNHAAAVDERLEVIKVRPRSTASSWWVSECVHATVPLEPMSCAAQCRGFSGIVKPLTTFRIGLPGVIVQSHSEQLAQRRGEGMQLRLIKHAE